jgi:uncharacterized protein (TIGR04255 family)
MTTPARRQYRKPPIVEAVCEFRFVATADWDPAIPWRFRERVQDEYAGKPINQVALEADLKKEPGESSVSFKQGVVKVQFPNRDGNRLVAVGPHVLSVHVRQPYPGWDEDFRPRIERGLVAYAAAASPEGFTRVGIRYINQVVLPKEKTGLEPFLNHLPQRVEGLPADVLSAFSRAELGYEERGRKLILTWATQRSEAGASTLLLDLDTVWEASDGPLPMDAALGIASELRERERVAFEALITDETRRIFDAD